MTDDKIIASIMITAVAFLVAVVFFVLIPSTRLDAATKPYTVYRIPKGCLYINNTSRAMVFVPDDERGPCDGAKVK